MVANQLTLIYCCPEGGGKKEKIILVFSAWVQCNQTGKREAEPKRWCHKKDLISVA